MATSLSQSEYDDKEELVNCPICYEPFEQPKVLPCLHTFCKRCLVGILQASGYMAVEGHMTCPTCRESVPLPHDGIDGFRDDFKVRKINEMFEKLALNQEMISQHIRCDLCKVSNRMSVPLPASSYCQKCRKFFCEDCKQNHEKSPLLKDHVMEPLKELVYLGAVHCMSIDQTIARVRRLNRHEKETDDDLYLMELDMMLSKEEMDAYQSFRYSFPFYRNKRKAGRAPPFERWPNKYVPYKVSKDMGLLDILEIIKAIEEWNRYTCLKFLLAKKEDKDGVFIKNGPGCSSRVGKKGGFQPVELAGDGCRHKGIIVHELGHAIGFFHEQSRPDRDQFVTIVRGNIESGKEHNFDSHSSRFIDTFGVPYDYESVMHFGQTAFSGNGRPTILTKDPAFQDKIGNRDGLSFKDIWLANLMYGCADHCKKLRLPKCPRGAFRDKNCDCMCPGKPVKKC